MKEKNANTGISEGLTREQHDLCYTIQLALIKAIINLDHEEMWGLIEKTIQEWQRNSAY